MPHRATGPYRHPLAHELPRGILGWHFVSFALHAALLAGLLVLLPGGKAPPKPRGAAHASLRLRTKAPAAEVSELLEQDVFDEGLSFERADGDLRWAAAVAAFGMLLRDSEHKGAATWARVLDWAGGALGEDLGGYRAEFLTLVQRARRLAEAQRE